MGLVTVACINFDAQARSVASRATASLSSPQLLDHIPEEWIDVLIQVEDPSFYDHPGVDLRTPGQGWTTITQGIVKRYFGGSLAGVWGKSRQSLLALALNRHLTKKQQLQVFLESAYFGSYNGRELVGFEDASATLYGKSLLRLTRSEYIGLVAMLVGPNRYNPLERPSDHGERVARIEALLAGRCGHLSRRDVYLEDCEVHE